MNTATEGRAFVLIVGVILLVGVASSLLGITGSVAGAVLLAAALVWLVAAMVRRERRIRARLADPCTRPHPGQVPAGRGQGVA